MSCYRHGMCGCGPSGRRTGVVESFDPKLGVIKVKVQAIGPVFIDIEPNTTPPHNGKFVLVTTRQLPSGMIDWVLTG